MLNILKVNFSDAFHSHSSFVVRACLYDILDAYNSCAFGKVESCLPTTIGTVFYLYTCMYKLYLHVFRLSYFELITHVMAHKNLIPFRLCNHFSLSKCALRSGPKETCNLVKSDIACKAMK